MRRGIAAIGLVSVVAVAAPAWAETGKGLLFHDGDVVRTVVNSGAVPHGGTDPFYVVTNPAEGQLGIAGTAPGDPGYRGGAWAVHMVTFADGVEPYLLTSDEAVMAAAAAGDVTVERNSAADFRCPVQP
jgi:hypothetical protein